MIKKDIVVAAMSIGLAGTLLFGIVGCSDNQQSMSTPPVQSNNANQNTSQLDCKTPSGQSFKGQNAILIRQIAQSEASMGNDGFNCQ